MELGIVILIFFHILNCLYYYYYKKVILLLQFETWCVFLISWSIFAMYISLSYHGHIGSFALLILEL